MPDFNLFVKFGLVLTYILKVNCRKFSSILLRKNMFIFITCILLLKSMYLHVANLPSFERFLC